MRNMKDVVMEDGNTKVEKLVHIYIGMVKETHVCERK